MSTQYLADRSEVRGAAGAGGEDLGDLAEIGRSEQARARDRQERRVTAAVVLESVDLPAPHPLDLAIQTRMTKQALNYLLGQLEQLGYLTRETDSDDQRSKRIRLTPRGHAATKAIYESVQDVETEWEQQLGSRKFAQLRSLLTELNAIVSPTNDHA